MSLSVKNSWKPFGPKRGGTTYSIHDRQNYCNTLLLFCLLAGLFSNRQKLTCNVVFSLNSGFVCYDILFHRAAYIIHVILVKFMHCSSGWWDDGLKFLLNTNFGHLWLVVSQVHGIRNQCIMRIICFKIYLQIWEFKYIMYNNF